MEVFVDGMRHISGGATPMESSIIPGGLFQSVPPEEPSRPTGCRLDAGQNPEIYLCARIVSLRDAAFAGGG